MVSLEYSPEYGTFELQVHPEFYCSNEVIAGHVYMYCGETLLLYERYWKIPTLIPVNTFDVKCIERHDDRNKPWRYVYVHHLTVRLDLSSNTKVIFTSQGIVISYLYLLTKEAIKNWACIRLVPDASYGIN